MRTVACLVAAALCGWTVSGSSGAPPERLPDLAPAGPYGVGPHPGAASAGLSCAAASCHGGGQVGRPGSEYSTWATDLTTAPGAAHDPHARAYRVLFNAASVRMAELLEPDAGKRVPPHRNGLCLKCHAVAGVKEEYARAEGVSCAGCHGPGEKWLTTHYLPAWKTLSNREKAAHGFTPTKNLVARAANCATCHVGAADRNVDHDLIAAGHPRLAFEYTRFHFQPAYRKHWTERAPQPDFEVRAWAVGQVASLRAALDLLRARAAGAVTDPPTRAWPEFAGYSCYACHQTVGDREPAGPGPGLRPLGQPEWEAWYTAAAEPAARATTELYPGLPAFPSAAVTELRDVMNRRRTADGTVGRSPQPADVKEKAAAAVAALDAWLAAVQDAEDRAGADRLPPGLPQRLARDLAGRAGGAAGWDALASHYLGCAAVYHATGGAGANPGWADPLAQARDRLRFPRPAGGVRFDGPAGFGRLDADAVRGAFKAIAGGNELPGGDR